MEKALLFDEKTLRRLHPLFTLIFVMLLGFPILAIGYFGVDLSDVNDAFDNQYLESLITESQLRSYFIQMLLQWSAFSSAMITTLLAFTQYRLTRNKIAFIIGVTILFSGIMEVLHPFFINKFASYLDPQINSNTLYWAFTNLSSGLLLLFGLLWLRFAKNKLALWLASLSLLAIFAIWLIVTFNPNYQPNWLQDFREGLNLSIYLLVVCFLYSFTLKKHPGLLTNCIAYMALTQMTLAIYLLLTEHSSYGINSYAFDFINIIVYFIPFSCLIISYIFSYNAMLGAQNALKLSQEKLEYIASHVDLTNLYNRREFELLLDKTIHDSALTYTKFALFLIDIDNFKPINDNLGHIHGDQFLKHFTTTLLSLTRKDDIVARIGGDEFIIIVKNLKSINGAEKLAQRLVKGLSLPYPPDQPKISSSVSIGIAIYPVNANKGDELQKKADLAMYHAKKMGKNRHQFYSSLP
jgi:diguanylate cyclase (GGDEF)-like protein